MDEMAGVIVDVALHGGLISVLGYAIHGLYLDVVEFFQEEKEVTDESAVKPSVTLTAESREKVLAQSPWLFTNP